MDNNAFINVISNKNRQLHALRMQVSRRTVDVQKWKDLLEKGETNIALCRNDEAKIQSIKICSTQN